MRKGMPTRQREVDADAAHTDASSTSYTSTSSTATTATTTFDPEKALAEKNARAAEKGSAAFAVVGYAVCSSCMLVCNKVAVHELPAPSLVLFAQLFASAASVWAAGACGAITVDKLEVRKALAFAPVALAFLGVIFANMKTLQYANVETFIVFRASTPLVVSLCDFLFLGRALPGLRSWLSLLGLLAGAAGYVIAEAAAQAELAQPAGEGHGEGHGEGFGEGAGPAVSTEEAALWLGGGGGGGEGASSVSLSYAHWGYLWVGVWYCLFCFDQVYIKHAVESVAMESNWGRVFYCNLLAALPLLPGALPEAQAAEWTTRSVAALGVSCLLGCGISYFAFACRKLLSATAFTVVGNCCKIATVTINFLIWEHHASETGIAFLLLSLFAAAFYRQAPLRHPTSSSASSSALSSSSSSGTAKSLV